MAKDNQNPESAIEDMNEIYGTPLNGETNFNYTEASFKQHLDHNQKPTPPAMSLKAKPFQDAPILRPER